MRPFRPFEVTGGGPYRTPGTVEPLENKMTEEQIIYKWAKMLLFFIFWVLTVSNLDGHIGQYQKDTTQIKIKELEISSNAVKLQELKTEEAKHLLDRAMFESMTKGPK